MYREIWFEKHTFEKNDDMSFPLLYKNTVLAKYMGIY